MSSSSSVLARRNAFRVVGKSDIELRWRRLLGAAGPDGAGVGGADAAADAVRNCGGGRSAESAMMRRRLLGATGAGGAGVGGAGAATVAVRDCGGGRSAESAMMRPT